MLSDNDKLLGELKELSEVFIKEYPGAKDGVETFITWLVNHRYSISKVIIIEECRNAEELING